MGWALFLFDAVFLVRNCANPPAAFTCQLRIRCIPQDATPAEVHPLYRGIFNVNCKPLLPLVYQGWWDYSGLKQGGSSLVSPPVVIRWSGSPQMPTFDAAGVIVGGSPLMPAPSTLQSVRTLWCWCRVAGGIKDVSLYQFIMPKDSKL